MWLIGRTLALRDRGTKFKLAIAQPSPLKQILPSHTYDLKGHLLSQTPIPASNPWTYTRTLPHKQVPYLPGRVHRLSLLLPTGVPGPTALLLCAELGESMWWTPTTGPNSSNRRRTLHCLGVVPSVCLALSVIGPQVQRQLWPYLQCRYPGKRIAPPLMAKAIPEQMDLCSQTPGCFWFASAEGTPQCPWLPSVEVSPKGTSANYQAVVGMQAQLFSLTAACLTSSLELWVAPPD